MTIGNRIKNRREELKMSQDELAKRLGYKSRSSINKIELNLQNLTQRKIKAIADVLETTPGYIMGWDDLDETYDTEKLSAESAMYDTISSKYGNGAAESVNLYLSFHEKEREKLDSLLEGYSKLDEIDRAEVRGRITELIENILKSEKYSIQEGSSNGMAI